jgi:hypothetical protein
VASSQFVANVSAAEAVAEAAAQAAPKPKDTAAEQRRLSAAAGGGGAAARARTAAQAEKAAAVALGWKGAWHEARRSKRKEKAEEWSLLQAKGEGGLAAQRASLEQSLGADDDGKVKQ